MLRLVSMVDFLNPIERLKPEFLYSLFCLLTPATATWLHHQQQPLAPRRQTGPVWNQRTPALLPAHCQDLVRRSVLWYVQLTRCPATRPQSSGDWGREEGCWFKTWFGQNLEGVLVSGGAARTPSEHYRGTPEQGSKCSHKALDGLATYSGGTLPSTICRERLQHPLVLPLRKTEQKEEYLCSWKPT